MRAKLVENISFKRGENPHKKLNIGEFDPDRDYKAEWEATPDSNGYGYLVVPGKETMALDDIRKAYNNDPSIEWSNGEKRTKRSESTRNLFKDLTSMTQLKRFNIYYFSFDPGDHGSVSQSEGYLVSHNSDTLVFCIDPEYIAYNKEITIYAGQAYDIVEDLTMGWDNPVMMKLITDDDMSKIWNEYER